MNLRDLTCIPTGFSSTGKAQEAVAETKRFSQHTSCTAAGTPFLPLSRNMCHVDHDRRDMLVELVSFLPYILCLVCSFVRPVAGISR